MIPVYEFTKGGGFGVAPTIRTNMARKPNYKFERFERERAKAAKKAARAQAKAERAERRKAEEEGGEAVLGEGAPETVDDDGDGPAET